MNINDIEKIKKDCIQWIKNWFDKNGSDCNAVIGISGGKDSTVVAKLCCEALGKERVIGVLMPNGVQKDIDVSRKVVEYLDIKSIEINISAGLSGILKEIHSGKNGIIISKQTLINLPPRIRMVSLYAVSQSMNGRVANTCNLSEDYIGWATRYGDSAGDFSPLANLTCTEVKFLGKSLGIPDEFIEKVPADGLTDKSDEDNFGFTYECLDRYIRTGIISDLSIKEKIDYMHKSNKFKLEPMPSFDPFLDVDTFFYR